MPFQRRAGLPAPPVKARAPELAQIRKQGEDLACDSFDLSVALLVGADEIQGYVANAGGVEGAHAARDLLWRSQGRVALGGLAEVHGIAVAQRHGGRIEGLLVGIVEACEKEMTGA